MLRETKRALNPARPWGTGEIIKGFTANGDPVVSVNLYTTGSGTRSFDDPAQLGDLADYLLQASAWLQAQRKAGEQ